MRYISALKVIECLKNAPEEALSISEICRRIDLSYQPTYAHVRALEQMGAIVSEKPGREVNCRLASGPAAQLWLSICSLHEALFDGRYEALRPVVRALRAAIREGLGEGVEVVAVSWLERERAPVLLVSAVMPELSSAVSRLCQVVRDSNPNSQVHIHSPEEFAEFLTGCGRHLTHTALPLHGQQKFWEQALSAWGAPPEQPGKRPVD